MLLIYEEQMKIESKREKEREIERNEIKLSRLSKTPEGREERLLESREIGD